MCGIAGILMVDAMGNGPAPDRARLDKMTDAMAHRGPNGRGVLVAGPVGLGHRRLSIIDIDGGAQPLQRDNGRVVMTYNGELYNYRELRAELEALGETFKTQSDTEVLLAAVDVWGQAALKKLRGMFAFGIWDARKRTLLLARDPLGIKPLYVARTASAIVFGSEIGALVHGLPETPRGSLAAVDAYLRLGYIPSPFTIYHDVMEVEPGTVETYSADGARTVDRYYAHTFTHRGRSGADARAELQAIRAEVADSVRAHLVADVGVGAFLSGGIDSTLVVAEMAQLARDRIKAFTIGFDDAAYSELQWAQQAARALGVDLSYEILDERCLDDLPKIVEHCGQPFGDSSIVPTWRVSQLAAREVRVVLSGDGGDEVFGGYNSYVGYLDSSTSVHPVDLWRTLREQGPRLAARRIAKRGFDIAMRRSSNPRDRWQQQQMMVPDAQRARLWRAAMLPAQRQVNAHVDSIARALSADPPLDFAQEMDLRTYLPGDILKKVDIASMAHGLEVRPPLLDPRLMARAAQLPPHLRMGKGRVGKLLLKQLVAERMPAAFVHRKKTGFGIPRERWMSKGHAGATMLADVLSDENGRLRAWFEPAAIARVLAPPPRPYDTSGPAWLLLVLGLWLRAHPEVTFS